VQEEEFPTMGAEDFSYYGSQCPACFFLLGLLPEGQDRYPNLHSPYFDFNDDAISVGTSVFCELATSAIN
jgi:metal-dependent amidase/aminoacylase/carboxypeptidase family protein